MTTKKARKSADQPPYRRREPGIARFWENILLASETTPHEVETLRGASGIDHPIIAVGLDELRKRLLVIVKETDARAASMVQADLQLALPTIKIIIMRPVPVSIPAAYNEALRKRESYKEVGGYIREMWRRVRTVAPADLIEAWNDVEHPRVAIVLIRSGLDSPNAGPNRETSAIEQSIPNKAKQVIEEASAIDPTKRDRDLGICPVPLYDFPTEEINTLRETDDVEYVKRILLQHDFLQFFFPPPDILALGLVERMEIKKAVDLIHNIGKVSGMGHPLGSTELISHHQNLKNIIEQLQDRKLLVEGEVAFELSSEGHTIRQKIKFKPREGLLSKLLSRISLKVDIKKLLNIGGTKD